MSARMLVKSDAVWWCLVQLFSHAYDFVSLFPLFIALFAQRGWLRRAVFSYDGDDMAAFSYDVVGDYVNKQLMI